MNFRAASDMARREGGIGRRRKTQLHRPLECQDVEVLNRTDL